ncbi:MAG: peroxiredoxin family protein [Gammaproteobacteria bacterium]
MILDSLFIDRAAFAAGTGWQLKPEGACKGNVCIPLDVAPADPVDVASVARQIGLPLVQDSHTGLYALGPEAVNGRALTTAEAPDLSLPDRSGRPFQLSSLRGRKVLLYAWAPY